SDPGLVPQGGRRLDSAEELLDAEIEAHVAGRGRQERGGGAQGTVQGARKMGEQLRWTVREEGIVAGEQLVAAVSRERYLHVLAGEAREQERRQEARVRERLVQRGHRRRKQVEAILSGEALAQVLGAEAPRGEERERRLVETLLDESDGEGAQRLSVPRRQRGDRGRVDAAGEEHPDRYVRYQPPRDRRVEPFDEPL